MTNRKRFFCWWVGHRWHQYEWTELIWIPGMSRTTMSTVRTTVCDRCSLFLDPTGASE